MTCKSDFSLYFNQAGLAAIKSHRIGEEGDYKPTDGEARAMLLDLITAAEARGVAVSTQKLFVPHLELAKGTKSIPAKTLKKALTDAKSVAFLVGPTGPYVGIFTTEAPKREGSRIEAIPRQTGASVIRRQR